MFKVLELRFSFSTFVAGEIVDSPDFPMHSSVLEEPLTDPEVLQPAARGLSPCQKV